MSEEILNRGGGWKLVSYLPMTDAIGTTVPVDLLGNTWTRTAGTSQIVGDSEIGNCYQFNANGGISITPDPASPSDPLNLGWNSRPFRLEFLMKTIGSLSGTQCIFSKRKYVANNATTWLGLATQYQGLYYWRSLPDLAWTPNKKIVDGLWHSVALEYDGTKIELWQDNESLGTTTATPLGTLNNDPLQIGSNPPYPSNQYGFSGRISQFKLFSK